MPKFKKKEEYIMAAVKAPEESAPTKELEHEIPIAMDNLEAGEREALPKIDELLQNLYRSSNNPTARQLILTARRILSKI